MPCFSRVVGIIHQVNEEREIRTEKVSIFFCCLVLPNVVFEKCFRKKNRSLKTPKISISLVFRLAVLPYTLLDFGLSLPGSSITNGGYENSINDNHAIMNRSAATASPQSTAHHRPTTSRIMAVTSKTTNYDNTPDGSSSTQATIISEPYFDPQTPRNVTGLVGKQKKF